MINIINFRTLVIISWVIFLFPIIGGFYIEMLYWLFYDRKMLRENQKGFIIPPGFVSHWMNGVCGFGKGSSVILSILLLVLASYLTIRYIQFKNNNTSEDIVKQELYYVFIGCITIGSIYFILQLIMNSTLQGSITMGKLYGPGLFEYFIPFYFIFTIMLSYMYYIFMGKSVPNEYLFYTIPISILIIIYSVPIFGYKLYIKNKQNKVEKVADMELSSHLRNSSDDLSKLFKKYEININDPSGIGKIKLFMNK